MVNFFISTVLFLGVFTGMAEPLEKLPAPVPAPSLAAADLQGQTWRLTDYRGKIVVINFWATWCPPCVREMASLDSLNEKLAGRGRVIAVNMGEKRTVVEEFLQQHPLTLPIILDPQMQISSQWQVTGLPTTYIINSVGHVVYRVMGPQEWDRDGLVTQLEQLLDGGNNE